MEDKTITSYQGWELLETLPAGWKRDATVGSPLADYDFVTNGKSVLSGQQRALLRAERAEIKTIDEPPRPVAVPEPHKPEPVSAPYPAKTVNELARAKFQQRLLMDIKVDLMVCEIEGWSKLEYLQQLQALIGGLGQRA